MNEKKPQGFEWIKGYENIYAINKQGDIYSAYKKKLKTHDLNKTGYFITDLYKKSRRKKFYVHRLVAETFIENPENKKQVNHKNLNKIDNRVENLEWTTPGENTRHAYESGKVGVLSEVVEEIKKLYATGKHTQAELAEKYGVCSRTILRLVNGQTYNY